MLTLLGPITDGTENVTSLPVSTTYQNAQPQVIYSVYVQNLTPNDVVLLNTQFEITSNYSYTPGLSRYIVRTNSATSTQGEFVTKPVNNGLIRQEHHEVVLLVGVDSNMPAGNYYYNVVAQAVNGNAGPTDALVVEQNYGQCQALVFQRS